VKPNSPNPSQSEGKDIRSIYTIWDNGDPEMKCPDCGKEVTAVKEWDFTPKVHVKLYRCCGKTFREYIKK
jgi:hypothetical protein